MILSRRFQKFAIVFLVAISIVSCGKDVTPGEYIAKAKDHIDAGELKAASIELSNALQKKSDIVEARWLLGKVSLEMGDGARAEKEIKRAVELGLPLKEAQATLIKAIYLQGDPDRVIDESAKIASGSTKVNQATILGFSGQALIDKREFTSAKKVLDQALELDSNNLTSTLAMSALFGLQQNFEEARRWVNSAMKLDSTSPEAWSLLGDVELAEGNLEKAENAFNKTIEFRRYPSIDIAKRAITKLRLKKYKSADADINSLKQQGFKDHPYVNYIAGVSQFRQEKYKQALELFQLSYNKSPEFVSLLYYLAASHYLLGNMEQASIFAKQVYAAAPNSLTATKLLGSIQLSRTELNSANEVLEKALNKTPRDINLLKMLTSSSMLQGEFDKSIKYLQRIIQIAPDDSESKNQLMLAELLAGSSLSVAEAELITSGKGSQDDAFTREFLLATASFRDGNIGDAFQKAQQLQIRFPTKTDPLKLIAACFLAAGQWESAQIELQKVLKIEPSEPSALLNLARLEANKGNLKQAQDLLNKLISSHPRHEQAALLLAQIDTQRNGQKAGIKSLEKSFERHPKSTKIRTELAAAYLNEGRINKVIDITQNLSNAQTTKQPRLLEIRGKAQMLMGDAPSAVKSFEHWAELQPTSAQAQFLYSDALARNGQLNQAKQQLKKTLNLDPIFLPARVGEIKMLVFQQEIDAAKKALKKLKADFGSRAEVLGIEGWFALGTKDYTKAVNSLDETMKKQPSVETLILLVRALSFQEKYKEAIHVMQNWLSDHPQDITVLLHLAGGYLSLEQEDKAYETYLRINRLAPKHVPTLNNLAWLSRNKDLKSALNYAEQANEISPEDPFVLDTYGMLMAKSGKSKLGIRMMRNAIEKMPNNWEFYIHLGQSLADIKQFEEARKELNFIIQKAPNSEFAEQAKKLLTTLDS